MKKKLLYAVCMMLVSAVFVCGCSPEDLSKRFGEKAKAAKYGYEAFFRANVIEKDADQAGSGGGDYPCPEGEGFLQETYEYYFSKLSEGEQRLYCEIKEILGRMGENVLLTGLTAEEQDCDELVNKIFRCVLNDHPELFYVEGFLVTKYTRGKKITAVEFSGDYAGTYENNLERVGQIEAQASRVKQQFEEKKDRYEVVKGVYDWVIRSTEYVSGAPDNQNIYSVLVNHASVCQGYAKTMQYLLNQLQVPCTIVIGTARGSTAAQDAPHAWNLVNIDDQFYYLDATWGDASYAGQVNDSDCPDVRYEFLNITTAEMLIHHTPEEIVPLPNCSAKKASYYFREGAYFFSCDEEQAKALAKNCFSSGEREISLKCENQKIYEELKEKLVDGKLLLETLGPGRHSMAYLEDPDYLTMTFWVTSDE